MFFKCLTTVPILNWLNIYITHAAIGFQPKFNYITLLCLSLLKSLRPPIVMYLRPGSSVYFISSRTTGPISTKFSMIAPVLRRRKNTCKFPAPPPYPKSSNESKIRVATIKEVLKKSWATVWLY